jgi:hypothetical protein
VLLLDMPLDVVVPTGLPTNMAFDELLADFGIIKDIGVGKSAVMPLYVSCQVLWLPNSFGTMLAPNRE